MISSRPIRFRRNRPLPRKLHSSELGMVLATMDAARRENREDHEALLTAIESARTDRQMIRDAHRELASAVVEVRKDAAKDREEFKAHKAHHGLADAKPSGWVANLMTLAWWYPGRALMTLGGITVAPILGILAAVPEARDYVGRSAVKVWALWKAWSA